MGIGAIVGLVFGGKGLNKALNKALKFTRSAKIASAAQIGRRVDELHGKLDDVAQGQRTTAIIRAWTGKGFVDVIAGSGDRGLDKKILGALNGEKPAPNIKGLDAEQNALAYIKEKGWKPYAGAASKPVCPWCQNEIFNEGGVWSERPRRP
ncbi:hypothetical protein ONA70_29350 [Micromonospora yasonensis]|uniref:hypothetical protein n=1 Tax=Micromonospora yasonensis TaxID=1128667 RepID=UPI00222ECD50|nr:hypothetical protein [Micromonospora yasonensis]MCW3844203.1 hypothetical protein [Micromonospora yasonensis]